MSSHDPNGRRNRSLAASADAASPATLGAWIAAGRDGDRAAIDALCRHFQGRLELFVRLNMWPRAQRWTQPEDIVNQSLMEVLCSRALPPDAGPGELLRRLFRVAHSRICDAVNKNRRWFGESGPRAERDRQAPVPQVAGPVTLADMLAVVQRFVAHLAEQDPARGEVVRLHLSEGKSFEEIERMTGIKSDTAYRWYRLVSETLVRKLRGRSADG
ncbi:MAG: hypothetical protein GY711_08965 [bacterium]|nr:hypothetical protein [bacterium]